MGVAEAVRHGLRRVINRWSPPAETQAEPASGDAEHFESQAQAGGTGQASSGEAGWARPASALAGTPMVFRLPRGVAVVAAGAVLVLIVAAYWVGKSRGYSQAVANLGQTAAKRVQEGNAPHSGRGRVPKPRRYVEVRPAGTHDRHSEGQRESGSGPLGGFAGGGRTGASEAGQKAQERVKARVQRNDPRQKGLNYLIVARYPQAEAERLARFLVKRGMAMAVVPVPDSDRYHVVGLRGVTTDQYRAGQQEAYEQKLRSLGRAWKAANDDRGDDLGDMYWSRYNGPDQ